jgi:hypothetical protein
LLISAICAAAWQARLSWRMVIGWAGSRPGKSQPRGRAAFHQGAQQIEQVRREHDITVLAAFTLG